MPQRATVQRNKGAICQSLILLLTNESPLKLPNESGSCFSVCQRLLCSSESCNYLQLGHGQIILHVQLLLKERYGGTDGNSEPVRILYNSVNEWNSSDCQPPAVHFLSEAVHFGSPSGIHRNPD